MSKIVFVLGAGASAHCGTPLMGNFLEVAENLWRQGEVKEVAEHFKRVFEAVGFLQGIHSKAKIDTYNIETVYAAFEMGKLLNSLPGLEEMSTMEGCEPSVMFERLISSIKKVIAYTLEKTTKLPSKSHYDVDAPVYYFSFTDIIEKLIKLAVDCCSIITFNYDLGLDYSLFRRGISPDYGLNDIDTAKTPHVALLKLHGSLNWGKCSKCGETKPIRQFQYTSFSGRGYAIVPIISKLKVNCKCGELLDDDPFIIPPTWNKTGFHEQIDQVWQRAARELNDAEHIFVLGYSLPSTDLFFNYLFALGVNMRTILKGFYVYNTDSQVEGRFQKLLGSGIEERFKFYQCSFEDALSSATSFPTSLLGVKTVMQILSLR